jgi:hypothetical protein
VLEAFDMALRFFYRVSVVQTVLTFSLMLASIALGQSNVVGFLFSMFMQALFALYFKNRLAGEVARVFYIKVSPGDRYADTIDYCFVAGAVGITVVCIVRLIADVGWVELV